MQDQEDGPLFKFYNKIRDEGGDFMHEITRSGDVTLFAPSNQAWSTANIDNLYNREKLREILNLHLVRERLTVERIRDENKEQVCVPLNVDCTIFLLPCVVYILSVKVSCTITKCSNQFPDFIMG
jgi:uncharacterized surface protein with fasciclin (FAS1) repeats